jgi:hypothetical protein
LRKFAKSQLSFNWQQWRFLQLNCVLKFIIGFNGSIKILNKKQKERLRQIRHAELSFIRKVKSLQKKKEKNRAISQRGLSVYSDIASESDNRITIECAERLDLSSGINDTLKVVQNLRSKRLEKRKILFYLEIEKINYISPGAALLIASALDRKRMLSSNRARYVAVSADDWNPSVKQLLRQIGFLSLLGVKNIESEPGQDDTLDTEFLPMESGTAAEGKKAEKLNQNLTQLAHFVSDPPELFGAVTEAMTNTRQHAYIKPGKIQHWWFSASFDRSKNWMTVMFADHGEGIPHTLPKTHRESFKAVISMLAGDILARDAKLIEAAMEVGRSAAAGSTRGKGLKRNIQGFIESSNCGGRLRIISRKGYYNFERSSAGVESVTLKTLKTEFLGTLIEWGFQVTNDEY